MISRVFPVTALRSRLAFGRTIGLAYLLMRKLTYLLRFH